MKEEVGGVSKICKQQIELANVVSFNKQLSILITYLLNTYSRSEKGGFSWTILIFRDCFICIQQKQMNHIN